MDRKKLKKAAKDSLKGKYAEAIKLFLIYFLIIFGINFIIGFGFGFYAGITGNTINEFTMSIIEIVAGIISIVIESLIAFGMTSFYLKISRNEEVTYKELFSKKHLFWPYITIYIITSIFTFLWSLLFIIPGIIAAIAYTLVYFIKLDNENLKTLEVIKESKKLMQGHKWEYFVLNLSFIGWILLGILTAGILYFWLIPYISVTQANFYNYLKEKNCQ